MTVTNKTKTIISPLNPNKGVGAEWGDNTAYWGDATYGWGDIEVMTNKTKSSVTITDKVKTNV